MIDKMNICNGNIILDVATGTGDVVFEILKKYNIEIIGLDYADNMVKVAKRKAHNKNLSNKLSFIVGDGENLPFDNNSFDRLSISFGFRNIGHYEIALSEFYRVLKPNGILTILEFSEPKSIIFNFIYQFYFKNILPKIGALISKSDGYKYLPESVANFPNKNRVYNMISEAGFINATTYDLTFGICTIFKGCKK